ncbi:MAG TPA: hypothetical protein VNX68_19145, partial [Nitrosopumilaceae archaeon]|nr:hypothetical protein [Nitrosopumilaceae archaeon]
MTPYVFGNKDSFIFAENILNMTTMQLVFSTNNGKDWHSNTMDISNMTYTMGLFSFPHCRDLLRTFIRANDANIDDIYYIVHSSDFGAHWDTLGKPMEVGAWIAGNNCVQYISDASGIHNGAFINDVLRSQDHGSNWILDNGPILFEIDDFDFHNFSVMGGGAVVYAGNFDAHALHNQLWKTTDGGDGTLSANMFASSISFNYDPTLRSACDTSNLKIIYQNLSCNYSSLKNYAITGLDSAEFSLQWLHHLACDGIPDTILVKIFPFLSGPGKYSFNAHFENDEYQSIDTSFEFTISTASSPSATLR